MSRIRVLPAGWVDRNSERRAAGLINLLQRHARAGHSRRAPPAPCRPDRPRTRPRERTWRQRLAAMLATDAPEHRQTEQRPPMPITPWVAICARALAGMLAASAAIVAMIIATSLSLSCDCCGMRSEGTSCRRACRGVDLLRAVRLTSSASRARLVSLVGGTESAGRRSPAGAAAADGWPVPAPSCRKPRCAHLLVLGRRRSSTSPRPEPAW